MRWKLPGVEAGDVKEALVGLWGDRCYICGGPLGSMHVEHVKPRSAGGGDTLANLRPACARCNLAKGAKPLAEYLAHRQQRGEPVDESAHRAGLRPTASQLYTAASLGVTWSGKYAWAAKLGWLGAPTALGPTPLAIAWWSWQAWQIARSEPARKLGRRAKARWDERRAPDPDELAAMRDAIAARESACRAAAAANHPSAGPWSQAWRPGDTWLDCLERALENACRAADVDYWPRRDWHTANPTYVELSRWTLLKAMAASGCHIHVEDLDDGLDIPPPRPGGGTEARISPLANEIRARDRTRRPDNATAKEGRFSRVWAGLGRWRRVRPRQRPPEARPGDVPVPGPRSGRRRDRTRPR